MDALQKKMLIEAGIDVDDALARFMNNEMLLARFMKKFPADTEINTLQQAIKANDAQTALASSHTLKGMCSNLSMMTLTRLFTDQVAAFRNDDFTAAAEMMPDILTAYQTVVDTIRRCWG